jgi:hypothetical protein
VSELLLQLLLCVHVELQVTAHLGVACIQNSAACGGRPVREVHFARAEVVVVALCRLLLDKSAVHLSQSVDLLLLLHELSGGGFVGCLQLVLQSLQLLVQVLRIFLPHADFPLQLFAQLPLHLPVALKLPHLDIPLVQTSLQPPDHILQLIFLFLMLLLYQLYCQLLFLPYFADNTIVLLNGSIMDLFEN